MYVSLYILRRWTQTYIQAEVTAMWFLTSETQNNGLLLNFMYLLVECSHNW